MGVSHELKIDALKTAFENCLSGNECASHLAHRLPQGSLAIEKKCFNLLGRCFECQKEF